MSLVYTEAVLGWWDKVEYFFLTVYILYVQGGLCMYDEFNFYYYYNCGVNL